MLAEIFLIKIEAVLRASSAIGAVTDQHRRTPQPARSAHVSAGRVASHVVSVMSRNALDAFGQ